MSKQPDPNALRQSLALYEGLVSDAEAAIESLNIKLEGYRELVRINKKVLKDAKAA